MASPSSPASPNRLRVNITIAKPLHERLAEEARARGRDRSQLIEEALELYLALPYPLDSFQSVEDLPPPLRLLITRAVEDYLARRLKPIAQAES